jgi:hypothetical protein
MPAQDRTPAVAPFAQLEQFFPVPSPNIGFVRRKRLSKFHRRCIGNSLRPFGEKALALEREKSNPRVDRARPAPPVHPLPRDDLVAAPQPREGYRNASVSPSGKRQHDFAIANLFGRQTHRILRPDAP